MSVASRDGRASRSEKAAATREAITAAAMGEFADKGFAAARMEDVAKRAGVAKGTVYLHFRDKQSLFEGILRSVLVSPLAEAASAGPLPDETVRAFIERRLLPLFAEIGTSRRGDVVRLLIAEGGRCPELAETYYREVVQRGLGLLQSLGARAREAGEPGAEILETAPQLLFAPALVGLVWGGLFQHLQPIDASALMRAQLALIFGPWPAGCKPGAEQG